MAENENNKLVGKVWNYDGLSGKIVANDAVYVLNSKDVKCEKIQQSDLVSFYADTFYFNGETMLCARQVTKIVPEKEESQELKLK